MNDRTVPDESARSAAAQEAATTAPDRERPAETATLSGITPPPAPRVAAPRLLGPYRLLEPLGAGGMGIVYRAEDTRLQRQVALKVMRPEIAAGPQARQRFLREARTAAAVEHDHIITIYEADQTPDGALYIAMPLLQGETLEDRLLRSGPPPLSEALRLAAEIAEGLAAAHARGLIHRDIKPSNVWLESRGTGSGERSGPSGAATRVKILDFGLARPTGGAELSQSGLVVGTPAYMSPEQARGEELDARSDLFSLGGLLYRMCTDRLPFPGKGPLPVLQAVGKPPPSARAVRPEVPAALDDLLARLLAWEPADRPADAACVSAALRALLTQAPTGAAASTAHSAVTVAQTPQAEAPSAPARPRRRAWRSAACVGALALLAVGIVVPSLLVTPEPPGQPPAVGAPPATLRPIKGDLDVAILRNPTNNPRVLRLGDPDALPLDPRTDHLRIEARLNRPAYIYLVWVDTEGKAELISPWDFKKNVRPAGEAPRELVYLPDPLHGSPLGGGPPGTESIFLLTREEKLPEDVNVGKFFTGLPRQKWRHRQEAAWFENGVLVEGETGRAAVNFTGERGRPLLDVRVTIDDPVILTQTLWHTRLKGTFDYCRAVCFSNRGDRPEPRERP